MMRRSYFPHGTGHLEDSHSRAFDDNLDDDDDGDGDNGDDDHFLSE